MVQAALCITILTASSSHIRSIYTLPSILLVPCDASREPVYVSKQLEHLKTNVLSCSVREKAIKVNTVSE